MRFTGHTRAKPQTADESVIKYPRTCGAIGRTDKAVTGDFKMYMTRKRMEVEVGEKT